MAFNLPKPWSSSYAYPKNVLDEGLERHAFVTLEVPDGTYDNPDVGDGGFAVPQYVLDEGYGQGAYITAWAPRGTYYGPGIPYWLNQTGNLIKGTRQLTGPRDGCEYKLATLGDTSSTPGLDRPLPEPFHTFGQRAATAVLAHVKRVAPKKRKELLTRTLNRVDPSLWKRTQDFTQRYLKRGVAPAIAIHHGMARAMATGFAAEMVTAKRQGKVKKKSLLGLGSMEALGVVPAGASIKPTTGPTSVALPEFTSGASSDGVCTSDSKLIYVGGQWRVRSPGDACVAVSNADSANIIKTQPIYVGAFPIDPTNTTGQITTLTTPWQIPSQVAAWLAQAAQAASDAVTAANATGLKVRSPASPLPCSNALLNPFQQVTSTADTWPFFSGAASPVYGTTSWTATKVMTDYNIASVTSVKDAKGFAAHSVQYVGDPNTYTFYDTCDWSNALGAQVPTIDQIEARSGGIFSGSAYYSGLFGVFKNFDDLAAVDNALAANPPIAKFNHPVTGEMWGMWLAIVPNCRAAQQDPHAKSSGGPLAPPAAWSSSTDTPCGTHLEIGFRKIPSPNWMKPILQAIFYVPALIFTDIAIVIGDILGLLATLACDVLKNLQPGAIKGPNGPMIATAEQIAQALTRCTPPIPPPVPVSSPWTTYLIVGGVTVGLLAILTRNRKKVP